jgi:molybdopterin converting factor subunit 1
MRITVKLFALAKELVGAPEVTVDLPVDADVAALRRVLAAQHPALASLTGHAMMAVDRQFARDETPLAPGQEVALIPPVSGG